MEERLERLREEWRQAKVSDAKRAFDELTDEMRAEKLAKFGVLGMTAALVFVGVMSRTPGSVSAVAAFTLALVAELAFLRGRLGPAAFPG